LNVKLKVRRFVGAEVELRANNSDTVHLLAVLEIELEKHIKIAVRQEVISRPCFSSILAAGVALFFVRFR
jgi:hypothetical protein